MTNKILSQIRTKFKSNLTIGICVLLGLFILFYGYLYNKHQISFSRKLFNLTTGIQCPGCNIVLISIGTLRAQELPCYGYSRDTAPNLCGYAKNNILFKNNYTNAAFTLPANFSLLTSLIPDHHHMINTNQGYLNPEIKTLAQTLKKNGYETMYIGETNSIMLPLNRGTERGFDTILDNPPDDYGIDTDAWSKGLNKLYDNSVNNKPFFLFLRTYSTHEFQWFPVKNPIYVKDNYAYFNNLKKIITDTQDAYENIILPAKLRKDYALFSYLQDTYDDRIRATDEKLNDVFKFLNKKTIRDKTIVIIIGDHGNQFFEHGDYGHLDNLYNTTIKTPLIVSIPNAPSRQIDGLSQIIDIYPTVLGLTGIRKPYPLEGNDLTDLIRGKTKSADDYSISTLNGSSTITDGLYKLYYHANNEKYELFDLSDDPGENYDISRENPDLISRLSKIMNDRITKNNRFADINPIFPLWIDVSQ